MNELSLNGKQPLDLYNPELTDATRFDMNWFNLYIQQLDVASKDTEDTYIRSLKQFKAYLVETGTHTPIRQTILDFRTYLQGTKHAPNTVQLYLTVVKLFFDWLGTVQLYPNISKSVKGVKLSKDFKHDFLQPDQVRKLLGSVPRDTVLSKRNYALLALLVTAGLRTIEVQRAHYGDLSTMGGYPVLWVKGKGKSGYDDMVKLSDHVLDALKDYLSTRPNLSPESPLFASESNRTKGQAITTRTIRWLVKTYLRGVNIDTPRITAHSLRHTAATINLENGGTLTETKQLLRHADISTTMIYNHQLDRVHNQSEQRIDNAIFGD